jgi:lactose/L-arabinose transport system ATP-binding protein
MASVELQNVSKSYGTVQVIEGLDLKIEDGAFTVFVGPSGCGKSTLLRMIAGLEVITGGDVEIGGKRVNDADPIERGVAMVFQNYALYPHMTVEQNIGFSLRMAKFGKAEIANRVNAAAQTLQIEPLLKRRPAQLSGGQRQRVAIGRAIVRDPEVFLFDEPLSNLDAELRVSMRVEIAKLHQQLGSTMIYVTHDQTEAMTLADQIVVLRDGRIEQAGTPVELYDNPDNLFVAGFIGSPRMNFLKGTLAAGNGAKVALKAGTSFAAPAGLSGGAGATDVQVGIRPEHFVAAEGADVVLELKVDVVENLGGTRYLYGSVPSGENLVVEARERTDLRPGEATRIGFNLARTLLFSAAGKRLRPVN